MKTIYDYLYIFGLKPIFRLTIKFVSDPDELVGNDKISLAEVGGALTCLNSKPPNRDDYDSALKKYGVTIYWTGQSSIVDNETVPGTVVLYHEIGHAALFGSYRTAGKNTQWMVIDFENHIRKIYNAAWGTSLSERKYDPEHKKD